MSHIFLGSSACVTRIVSTCKVSSSSEKKINLKQNSQQTCNLTSVPVNVWKPSNDNVHFSPNTWQTNPMSITIFVSGDSKQNILSVFKWECM